MRWPEIVPLAAVAATALLTGCGNTIAPGVTGGSGSGGGGSTSSSSGTGGAPDPNDVTGTWVDHYFLADGSMVDRPMDLSTGIQAKVPQGSTWVTFSGTGKADGSFVIPGVPQGPYLIAGKSGSLQSSERVVDLGGDYLGRPDAVQVEGTTTMIAGKITNLDPWTIADSIAWISPNSNGSAEAPLMMAPNLGDTSLQGTSYLYLGGLVDGSKGDVLYLAQVAGQASSAGQITTVTRFASFTGLEQAGGATLDVAGALTQPPADQTLAIDFRGSQFAALTPSINPMAMGSTQVSIGATPSAASAGTLRGGMAIVGTFSDNMDVDLGAVKYANPFPSSFGQVIFASVQGTVPYPMSTGAPVHAFAAVSILVPAEQAGAGPIVPLLGPVQSPEINGQAAFGPLTGLSLPLTLTWQPPALGKAAGYVVSVHPILNVGGNGIVGNGASVTTTATSLTLPPEMAPSGFTYFFQITAKASPNDLAKQPFRASGSGASADLLTAAVAL